VVSPFSDRGGDAAGDMSPGGETVIHLVPVVTGGERVAADRKWGEMPLKADRNRCACPGEVKRFIARSRCRVGWCEFSVRSFNPWCERCSPQGITCRWAAPWLRSLSVTITLGTAWVFFSNLRKNRRDASRRFFRRMSSTVLVEGPPPIPHLPVDLDEDLAQMPGVPRLGPAPAQGGVGEAEPLGPLADRLVGDLDAALGHQLLDVPQAQGKANERATRSGR
jgi:hypothetical protein